MAVKFQGICRDFEYVRLKYGEALFDYLTKVFGLINQMKMYGEKLLNKRIFEKILISLTPQYDIIVVVIEGTKKISEIEPNEVVVTLKEFEQRLMTHLNDNDAIERAFSSLSLQGRNNN